MTTRHLPHERRGATRYTVKEHTFAVVRASRARDLEGLARMSHGQVGVALFKSKPAKMGQILDLSLKGLCFNYIANEDAVPEGAEVDILYAVDNFYLPLPCRVVREATEANELPFTPIVMKRRAVAFEDLSIEQERALSRFLQAHGQALEAAVEA